MAIYNISGGGGGSGGGTPAVDTSSLVPKSIGTAAGDIIYWSAANSPTRLGKGSDGQALILSSGVPTWSSVSATDTKNTAGSTNTSSLIYLIGATSQATNPVTYSRSTTYVDANGYLYSTRVYNAVWNDFAEFRVYDKEDKPYGRVVCEVGDDTTTLASKRLQPGAMICSDTFGSAVGDESGIPIAVAGRALAYTLEPREEYLNHIGEAVCAGPDGTVSIMTKEEQKEYPECVVGYISAVPNYEVWGSGNVKVDGRVWIKVK